jgi:glycosyltransferase involved in cell wall biosynthesis
MADHTRRYFKGPIRLTPFGVDSGRFKPANESGTPQEIVVGTVKALDEKYGIDYLIKSFALVTARHKGPRKMRLVIAGEGAEEEKLKGLARELGMEEITEFLGFVPNHDIPKLLNGFSVFVAVSVLDSETFGVAVVEASASGLPVVVSNVGGLGEVVRNGVTGLVVPRRDVEATAKAIASLVENENLRRELGAAGRKFVMQNYEWSENASRMERVYESMTGRDGASNHGKGELIRSNC